MVSRVPEAYQQLLEGLSVQDLELLLEKKKQNEVLKNLIEKRDQLRHDLRAVELQITEYEKKHSPAQKSGVAFPLPERRKTLKDYIIEVLSRAGTPLTPSEIQQRLIEVGYVSNSRNPRSFYNTVFQALQRYDCFTKQDRKYTLNEETAPAAEEVGNQGNLKDYIVAVLKQAKAPLKSTEISSRVVIAGYKTDLDIDELNQRVSATLKKYLNKDFDWDSQRYRLATNSDST